ncbi:MAG TPA: CcmD family protein [Limnochordales bacterium]
MTFLFLGYSIFWLILAGYVALLAARQRRLAEDVADLAQVLERSKGRKSG